MFCGYTWHTLKDIYISYHNQRTNLLSYLIKIHNIASSLRTTSYCATDFRIRSIYLAPYRHCSYLVPHRCRSHYYDYQESIVCIWVITMVFYHQVVMLWSYFGGWIGRWMDSNWMDGLVDRWVGGWWMECTGQMNGQTKWCMHGRRSDACTNLYR